MIPAALITGFLGSGKTAYLRYLMERHRDRRLVYLVNEFSPVDVDGRLLADPEDRVVSLPGGSIFCTCLVSEFIKTMTDIPERFHRDGAPPEGVVIEASGVANPRVVERMLHETRLDALFTLTAVVSVVDPGSFPTLVHTLPNIIDQVQASDTVILNKTDLFDEAAVANTEAEVRRVHPDARIVRAQYCAVDLDLFGERAERGMDGEYAPCADPNYARFVVRTDGPVDGERLVAELEALRGDIYRAKGFVNTGTGMRYLDCSPAAVTLQPAQCDADGTEFVMIVHAPAYERVKAFVARIKEGA
jgi:G3E family GTPase